MEFVDIVFIVGLLLLLIGSFSAISLLKLSINKTKEELKDINVANLWVLFILCCPVGLLLIYFWF
jgi:heme/copper-type cytochrome/quinol oxidase subunit 2